MRATRKWRGEGSLQDIESDKEIKHIIININDNPGKSATKHKKNISLAHLCWRFHVHNMHFYREISNNNNSFTVVELVNLYLSLDDGIYLFAIDLYIQTTGI